MSRVNVLIVILLVAAGAFGGYWLDRSLRNFTIAVHASCVHGVAI